MPGCIVDSNKSPQLNKLVRQWKKRYPSIESDLEDAYSAIRQDILAKKADRVKSGTTFEVYKYRQNSKDIKRGDRYGLRIIALYVKPTEPSTLGTMYPVIVYPKPEWSDAKTDFIVESIQEVRRMLGYCISKECAGRITISEPRQQRQEGDEMQSRHQCNVCGAVIWQLASDPTPRYLTAGGGGIIATDAN